MSQYFIHAVRVNSKIPLDPSRHGISLWRCKRIWFVIPDSFVNSDVVIWLGHSSQGCKKGPYTGTAGPYIKPYTGLYAGLYTGTYTRMYTGLYTRPYTGLYTGPYAGLYTGMYTAAYAGPYIRPYTGLYTGPY